MARKKKKTIHGRIVVPDEEELDDPIDDLVMKQSKKKQERGYGVYGTQ